MTASDRLGPSPTSYRRHRTLRQCRWSGQLVTATGWRWRL